MKKRFAVLLVCISGTVLAAETRKVVQNGFACQSKGTLKSIVDLKANAAAQKSALTKELSSGQCINLKKGDSVTVTGENFMLDLVKIKYASKPTEYWTTAEFVK
jgi:adenine deaminase